MSGRGKLTIGRGRTTRVDDTGPVQRHQVEGLDGELLEAVERVTDYGFASHPYPDAEGVLLAVTGARGQSVLVAVGDRRYRFQLAEGEVALFDDQGQSVHLTREGIVVTSPLKIDVVSPEVTITASTKATIAAPTIVLEGAVFLGDEDGVKAIARHDDAVVAGKVVATSTTVKSK